MPVLSQNSSKPVLNRGASEDVLSDPGFGVYIHWPFCAAKCPYCDFNSHVRHEAAGGIDEQGFLGAYRKELATMAEMSPGRRVRSIFIGGGTPSLMSADIVGALLDDVAMLWPVEADAEITLEANPSSVEADRFKGYASAGVNRVSLGVQALNDVDLKALGRLHNAEEARRALDVANQNFDRVSFDLIYARPKQSEEAWAAELQEGLALAGGHLSLYQLTIEPGTPFAALHASGKLVVPDDVQGQALYEVTQEICEQAGLHAYEVSNHARPGEESRHNLIYWRYGDYAGVGPGAHGRLVSDGVRYALSTLLSPEGWRDQVLSQGDGLAAREELSLEAQAQEMLLMGLRLSEGVELARLEALTGFRVDDAVIANLAEEGLVVLEETSMLRATTQGRLVLNSLIAEIASGLKN